MRTASPATAIAIVPPRGFMPCSIPRLGAARFGIATAKSAWARAGARPRQPLLNPRRLPHLRKREASMSLKGFLFLVPVAVGGWYVVGGSGAGLSREVNRPPAAVAAAIADLDIRRQPGSPGTDPAASGGVAPVFRHEQTAEGMVFTIYSGDKVATRMIAHLEPLDGGRRTRVWAEVERGDAPDALVSPAFRSTGITLGLFNAALGDELDDLASPPRRSAAECQELERELLEANAPRDQNPLRAIAAVRAVAAELRSRGCDTHAHADEPFQPMVSRMGNAPPSAMAAPPAEGVSFAPGRPMVDVRTGEH